MTGIEIAGVLKEYGGWGLSALLILAIVKLYRDKEALSSGYLERLVTGIAAATQAANTTKETLDKLGALIDASGETVGEHSHQIAILVEKIQHGFGNTASSLDGVARRLEKLSEQIPPKGRS